jgi:hypothetical protein
MRINLLTCFTGSGVRDADQRSEEALRKFVAKLDNGVGDSIEEIGRLIRQDRDRREKGENEAR